MGLEEDRVARMKQEPLAPDRILRAEHGVPEPSGAVLHHERDPKSAQGLVEAASLGEPVGLPAMTSEKRGVDGEIVADGLGVPGLVDDRQVERARSDERFDHEVGHRFQHR
jgi:hypothetical protein